MMFGKCHKGPCPMCTSFLDVLNGMAVHLEQKVDLAAIVAADPAAGLITRHSENASAKKSLPGPLSGMRRSTQSVQLHPGWMDVGASLGPNSASSG